MSQLLTVAAGTTSPPIPVNQYSVVQVSPNATPGSISVLYSQDSDTYIRAGTATWTAWPNGSVTSSSSMMSNARMTIQVSAQSSAASVSVSDPTPGVQELVVSPWVGAEAGAMTFSSSVTFQGQILAANGSSSQPSFSFSANPSTGWYSSGSNILGTVAGTPRIGLSTVGVQLDSGYQLTWSGSIVGQTTDLILLRDAAGVLAMRNGPVSSQTLRIYGKFGATSTFASFSHNGTNAVMSTQGGGLSLSASTMGFFTVPATTQPNVSTAVTTTAGTSVTPFGFATAQQFQDTVNAVNFLQNAMKQLGLSA